MKVDGIVFKHKFTQVPNRLLTCRRMNKYTLLLSVMINLRNMRVLRKPPEPNPNELTIPKRQLRLALGFCGESAIEKQLNELRTLDIVTSFSKQDGEDGYFSVTLADNLEDSPYVVLDVAEKQVIQNCKVSVKKGSKDTLRDLFTIVEKAANSVEVDYIKRLSRDAGGLDECLIVKEYKEYLISTIVKSGLGTFDDDSKEVPKTSNRRISTKAAAQKTQAVQEAKQERKGLSLEELDRILGGS